MNTQLAPAVSTNTRSAIKLSVERMVQRQCACGQHTSAGEECEACKQQHAGLIQRAAIDRSPQHGAPRATDQLPEANTGGFAAARSGWDFSGVATYAATSSTKLPTRLPVNQPGDAYEQEADRIASQVLAVPSSPATSERIPHLQRFAAGTSEPASLVPSRSAQPIEAAALSAGGSPLDLTARGYYEPRFNRDLSGVRVHAGPAAAEYCQRLDAHAFTYGNHVWLGEGAAAGSPFVLAHELAHVIQQTQPAALTDGGREGADASPASHRMVQRLPFWVPIETGKIMSGTQIHKELLGQVDGKNNVTIEAPVPNATRAGVGLGLQGFADLYSAASRVGVFFKPRQGLMVGDTKGNLRHVNPAKTTKAGKSPKPAVSATGAITDIASGPKSIKLGELKPAALTELAKGDKQLDNYKQGFEDAAKLTNLWAADQKLKDRWNLNSVTRLSDKAVQVAPQHDPASASGGGRNLALADIDESRSEATKYTVRQLLVPKAYLGQNIPGKLYMEPFGQGLWMYYARPDDFSQALDVPTFKRDEQQAYMRVAQAVQNEVIGNLTRGPKRITLFPRSRRSPIAVPIARVSHVPAAIARKPKNSNLKDDFDQKAYEAWSKRQSELGAEVRGKAPGSATTASTFKKLEFLELASKAEQAITPKAHKKTANFPTAAQLKEKIVTGTGKDKAVKETSLDRLFGWLERWTSPAYKILGQFRLRFGTVFVAAVNKFNEIKESVSKRVHDFFEKHPAARKTGKVLFKALATALKQVVAIVVPQTLHLVMQAITNGIKRKLEELFADTFIEKMIDKFKEWWADIQEYADKAKEYIEKVKKDFLEKFDWVEPLINDVKWFWRIVKAGRVLLKCRKPPLLGCLALLKDAATDAELSCVLCIPWVQKQIGKYVMAVPWFNNIPNRLGNLILETLRDAVPDNAKILKDIFSEKIPEEKPDIEDLVPECDAQCSGFGLFKGGGAGGDVSQAEAEAAKKMADFGEKLSKDQIEDLLKEAERRGMLDKPFDQKQAEQLLKDAEQKKKDQGADKDKDKPQPEPEQKKTDQPSGKPQQPAAPKDRQKADQSAQQKAQPKGQKQTGDQPQGTGQQAQRPARPSKQAPSGKGAQGGAVCVWSPSEISVGAWILDGSTDDAGGDILAHGDSFEVFSKQPISRDCRARLVIKNDFQFGGCMRPGKFTKPKVTTEVRFKGKELFKRTDDKPWANEFFAEPKWGDRFVLPVITESGDLQIKVTLEDPDTGAVKTFDDKVKIDIVTKDKCCDCIS